MARIIILFAVFIVLHLDAVAQGTSALKQGKNWISVLESTAQRILPGRRESGISTNYHFIVIWKEKASPASFFWRGQNGWLSCNIQKVHKAKQGAMYTPDAAGLTASIHKGDTLELIPVTGGRFPVPAQIPDSAVNTLFFKTTNTGWHYYAFKKLTQKPDIIMP